MSDERGWLQGGDGLERELLASVRDVRAPAAAKEQAWQGIAAQLAIGAVVSGAAASSAAASSSVAPPAVAGALSSALATKLVGVLAASGWVAAGGYYAVRQLNDAQRPPPPARAAEVAAPREVGKPQLAVPEQAVAPEASREQAAASEEAPGRGALREPSRKAEAKRSDALSAESAALTRARAALRAGDLAAAGRMLERMDGAFPSGVLAQERELLAIEVLAARGEAEAARARAHAFAKAYPSSPHTARLRPLLDAP